MINTKKIIVTEIRVIHIDISNVSSFCQCRELLKFTRVLTAL